MKRDKEGHYIMIKGSIQEEDRTIINIYALNIRALQYVRQMLTSMKGEINSNAIIVGDFNTPLTPKDRSTKQKITKETQTLNDIMDQLDLIDIYRTIHPKTINFTFFSSAHGTFSRIDHIQGHKSSLGKFKKVEIISSIFSDHAKVHLVKAMAFPVVMYGCESWTVKKAESRRIDAFELWCWRRLLRVLWTARKSSQSILKEISPGCSLERLMLKLKLQYFGHLM